MKILLNNSKNYLVVDNNLNSEQLKDILLNVLEELPESCFYQC